MTIALRPYQVTGCDKIRFEFRVHNEVLYVLVTGGGKTFLFSYIAMQAASKGRHVIIIVHRKELLLQASRSLRDLGIEHGLISPFFTPDRTKRIQVASVDTLLIRLKKNKYPCDLLIVDEAHHCVADNKWGQVYELLGRPKMLGVTATPVRSDGKGLGDHAGGLFKSMVVGPSAQELIDMGMLVKPIVHASLDQPDFTGLKTDKTGELNLSSMAARIDKPVITGSAVETYKRVCPGARAVVFCCSIMHCKHVVDEFNAAGFRFALLVGAPEMSDAERTSVNKRIRSGELDGIVSVSLVSEGYDVPGLECCIMLRRTESEGLFLQMVGRIMRPAADKRGCWLNDHVGNTGMMIGSEFKTKHGFPHWEREWTLDGRLKRGRGKKDADEATIALAQCPKCFLVHDPEPACPHCGHIYQIKGRSIEQVDGELGRVTDEIEEQAEANRHRREQGAARSVDEMVKNLGYSIKRAEKIVAAREEKDNLRNSLVSDLQKWRETTGETPLGMFDIAISDLKNFKPKALKELREKFDAHVLARTAHITEAPGDDKEFGNYLRRTVGARPAPVQHNLTPADGEEF